MRTRLILALSVAVLAACGGGGDDAPAPAPVPTKAVQQDPYAAYQLQNEVPAVQYGSEFIDPVRKGNVEALNAIRQKMGLGLLRQSTALDRAAQAHAAYNMTKGNDDAPSPHDEVEGKPGFTGVRPEARARAAGYRGTATEGIYWQYAPKSGPVNLSECVGGLLGAPYHADTLLSDAMDVGIGLVEAPFWPNTYYCVVMVGWPSEGQQRQQPRESTGPFVYPHADQTGAPTKFWGEVPDPVPDLSKPRGAFVSVFMRSFETMGGGDVKALRFVVKDPGGNLLPARLILGDVGAGPNLEAVFNPNQQAGYWLRGVHLLPLAPLLPRTRYTVEFEGSSRGNPMNKTWSFQTGDEIEDSVAASIPRPH